MSYEELEELFNEFGELMLSYNFKTHELQEVVNDILYIETGLFRARIKLIRENPELY